MEQFNQQRYALYMAALSECEQAGFARFRRLSTPRQHREIRDCGRLELALHSGGQNNRPRCAHRERRGAGTSA
jgi:hypothetical protein